LLRFLFPSRSSQHTEHLRFVRGYQHVNSYYERVRKIDRLQMTSYRLSKTLAIGVALYLSTRTVKIGRKPIE